MIGRNVIVHGNVQGVGYRYHTLLAAQQHNISGWVLNIEDGSVMIMAIGIAKDMEAFLQECDKGPALSNVTEMIITDAPLTPITGFKIIK